LDSESKMEAHDVFLALLIILLTARIFSELVTRLQTPSVIGELVAGVLLGPSLLGVGRNDRGNPADGRDWHDPVAVRVGAGDRRQTPGTHRIS
jgi:hypothetical protein